MVARLVSSGTGDVGTCRGMAVTRTSKFFTDSSLQHLILHCRHLGLIRELDEAWVMH